MKLLLDKAHSALEQNRQKRGEHFYPRYHLTPPAGWMNDPNGLICFKGKYHAFYQHHPYDENWGPMHWGHAISDDMVHWQHLPIALAPGSHDGDADGCFSGSAVDDNGVLSLVYTGHVWLEEDKKDGKIRQVQCLATSQDGIHFENQGVVLTPPDGYMHFRDPKVWFENGYWWMVIGARDAQDVGQVLLYKGLNLKEWVLDRVLAKAESDHGYMWECPDFFALNKKHYLMCSPQGIAAKGYHNRNLFQSAYLMGQWATGQDFNHEQNFIELDNGHDFYAPQTFLAADGRRIVMAWMDMWESPMPAKKEGWAGSLTLPRELVAQADGRLHQVPVKELLSLRQGAQNIDAQVLKTERKTLSSAIDIAEIELAFNIQDSDAESYGLQLGEGLKIYIDDQTRRLVLWRSYPDENIDGYRSIALPAGETLGLRIFIDRSSVEVFVNNGQYCFTSRIYPSSQDSRLLKLFANNGSAKIREGKIWQLNLAV